MAGNTRSNLLVVLAIAAVAIFWYRSTVYEPAATFVRPKLVVLTGGDGPYWQLMVEGARQAATDFDADIELLMPEGDDDFKQQNIMLMALKPEGTDGVAISPLDADKQTRFINSLSDQAIVVTVDSDAPLSDRSCYVGASNYAAGQKCAEQVQEAIPAGGRVVVCLANLTKDNLIERRRGMEEFFAESAEESGDQAPQYEIVEWLTDDGDRKRCREQLVEYLQQHDDIDCVVGLNAFHGGEILAAVEQVGREDQMKIVAFDTEQATLDGVADGKIHATIAQDPYQYGYAAVRQLASLCRCDEQRRAPVGMRSTYNVDTRVLHQQDVDEYREKFLKNTKQDGKS
ncbi:substrate-binding domain-containing protein [Aeoliella sp. ICT_H6.2]|uniref:Substrate-binding domain-containing protein n=1 Tax=Aeoliella straminimaris TaxID=2954799 RepID=A0A9X2F6A3_9BACT|nr:substrate-binding domain-containing protein [Aeoliella straminimaris]MCO6043020.1 substrate-binding domain-containing protein [Aeoliella straminimaris]